MRASKPELISVKRNLFSAKTMIQEAAAAARGTNEKALSERLRGVAERLAAELDFIEGLLGGPG